MRLISPLLLFFAALLISGAVAFSFFAPLLLESAAIYLESASAAASYSDLELQGDGWLDLFNQRRKEAGIPAVRFNSELSADLELHARYMLLNAHSQEIEHREYPDSPGYTQAGHRAAMESNLIIFTPKPGRDLAFVIDSWMNSLSHRQGMLNPHLQETGFAIQCDEIYCAGGLNVHQMVAWGSTPRPEGVVWPGDGQQNVNVGIIPSWSYYEGAGTIQVASASLNAADGRAVVLRAEQPFQGMVALHPQAALQPDTAYTVRLDLKVDGRAFTRTWRFQTAP